MKQSKFVLTLVCVLALSTHNHPASGQQALPTASRTLQLSAFSGLSGVYTGLGGGRNLSFTAGADLGLPPWRGVRPTIEVRGTYPIDGGVIDAQKSIFGGAKFDFLLNRRVHPYGDFLIGRGEITYHSGYPFNNQLYILTTTNVLSPGGGIDYDLTEHFGVKLDGQFQRWGYAPTPSGNIYSKVITAAVIYRFTFDHRHHH